MTALHIHQIRAKLAYCYPHNFNSEDKQLLPEAKDRDSIDVLTRLTRKALLTNSVQGLDIIAEHLTTHSNDIYTSEAVCLSGIDECLAFHSHPTKIQIGIYHEILRKGLATHL